MCAEPCQHFFQSGETIRNIPDGDGDRTLFLSGGMRVIGGWQFAPREQRNPSGRFLRGRELRDICRCGHIPSVFSVLGQIWIKNWMASAATKQHANVAGHRFYKWQLFFGASPPGAHAPVSFRVDCNERRLVSRIRIMNAIKTSSRQREWFLSLLSSHSVVMSPEWKGTTSGVRLFKTGPSPITEPTSPDFSRFRFWWIMARVVWSGLHQYRPLDMPYSRSSLWVKWAMATSRQTSLCLCRWTHPSPPQYLPSGLRAG